MTPRNSFQGFSSLAGALRVVPGAQPPHALLSTRRDWAPRLAKGQVAAALPNLMASTFNLCSQAHRLCARLAIQAVAPLWRDTPPDVARSLRVETAQEHIRRMALDWPRLLSGTGAELAFARIAHDTVRRCPLFASDPNPDSWPATLDWLQREWLQMPAAVWEAQWRADGVSWLTAWTRRREGWLASLLCDAAAPDEVALVDPKAALPAPASEADARTLARLLSTQPGFALAPTWNGACAHTGCWTRQASSRPITPMTPMTPWELLGRRLSELIRLCLEGTGSQHAPDTLSFGAAQTGESQALAWVEMARGLLVYRVELHRAQGPATIVSCQVVAPTEWNFHAHGVVARHIATLDADQPAELLDRKVRMLMAAFDPCVPFEVLCARSSAEVSDA